jgi:hypothetical protein
MKKSLLVVALFVASMVQFSCSKEEVIPNITGKTIAGNYQITYLSINKTSYEMPYNTDGFLLTGILMFSPSNYKPELPFGKARTMVFIDGAVQMDVTSNIDMEDITSNSCSLYENGVKIGRYYKVGVNEIIELNGVDNKGSRVIVKCQK